MSERLHVASQSQDFEKWLRMATDNKINTQNSWNLSLIDYFHELTFLKDGDNVNFQKASATLDGCVKIYVSRVDSAATETGKLLNGLSNNGQNKKSNNNLQSIENNEGDDFDEDRVSESTRRAPAKNFIKHTLVKFEVIKAKKGDLESYVDPLMKKSIADFDEGGTKSLLLNMLNVNTDMKVVLDTTDTAEAVDLGHDEEENNSEKVENNAEILTELNKDQEVVTIIETEKSDFVEDGAQTGSLSEKLSETPMEAGTHKANEGEEMDRSMTEEEMDQFILGNINKLSDKISIIFRQSALDTCLSLKEVKAVMNGDREADHLLRELETMASYHFPSTPTNMDVIYDEGPQDFSFGGDYDNYDEYDSVNEENLANTSKFNSIFFDEDMDDEIDNFGISMRMLFNQEKSFIDAREATMIEQDDDDDDNKNGAITNMADEKLIAYFDNNQRHNWAGPEHWKIQKVKKAYNLDELNKINSEGNRNQEELDDEGNPVEKQASKKTKFSINFMSDIDSLDPKEFMRTDRPQKLRVADMTSKTHHVLPDDKNFTTRNFIRLFIKDQVIHSRFNNAIRNDDIIGASVFANSARLSDHDNTVINNADFFDDNDDNHYENNCYDDYDDDYDAYGDLQQLQPQPPSSVTASQKNQPISFSRVAKRVDVRLLKDTLWNTLSQEITIRNTQASQTQAQIIPETSQPPEIIGFDEAHSPPRKRPTLLTLSESVEPLKFSDIVHDLSGRYEGKAKSDLSTSFCFISLLHLANEKGFKIESIQDNKDLLIKDIPSDEVLIP